MSQSQTAYDLIPNGTPVLIDQGSGRFTEAVVEGYTEKANSLGNKGNYFVRVTGGVNVFGKPVQVGEQRAVFFKNVRLA